MRSFSMWRSLVSPTPRVRASFPPALRTGALIVVLFLAGCAGPAADEGAVLRGWLAVETKALPLPAGDGILVLGGGLGGPRVGVVEPGRVRLSVAPDEPAGGPENGRASRAAFSHDRAFVAILTHDGQGQRAITLGPYALGDGDAAWELPRGAARLLGFGLARGVDRVVAVYSSPGEERNATIALIEAGAGRIAERASVGGPVAGALVLDDRVLVHHFDAIEAFDATDGRRLWRTELPMHQEDERTNASVVTELFRGPLSVHARLGTAVVALLSTIDPATGAFADRVQSPGNHVIAAAATPGRMFFVTSSDPLALHVEGQASVSG